MAVTDEYFRTFRRRRGWHRGVHRTSFRQLFVARLLSGWQLLLHLRSGPARSSHKRPPNISLAAVDDTNADPKLEIFPIVASPPILANDNWSDNSDAAYTAQIAAQVSAFPLPAGTKDAAFVVTLPPGVYTVIGSSADDGGTGVVLVEIYVVP